MLHSSLNLTCIHNPINENYVNLFGQTCFIFHLLVSNYMLNKTMNKTIENKQTSV